MIYCENVQKQTYSNFLIFNYWLACLESVKKECINMILTCTSLKSPG